MAHPKKEAHDVEMIELQAAVPARLWRQLQGALRAASESGSGDAGVLAYIQGLHLSESDRRLLSLAYSLWRGVGPAVEIQALWGMEAKVARRVLASLAIAAGREEAADLLRTAAELVDEITLNQEPKLALVDGNTGD